MNEYNYVAPTEGGWIVVVDGRILGTFNSQQIAEQEYINNAAPEYGGRPTGTVGTPAGSASTFPGYGGNSNYTPPTMPNYPIVGATGQPNGFNDAAQMAYMIRKLEELEIPGLNLQQKNQMLQALMNQASLTGYVDPNLWQGLLGGATSGTATGSYQTANGAKTLQQMRAELVQASQGSGGWDSAGDDQILAEYAKVTGGGVTPVTTGSTGTGTGATGSQSTLAREMYEKDLAERMRQFNASQGQQSEQYWGGLLASLSGPRDWRKYQIAQSQLPESVRGSANLMDIFSATPAFGGVQADPSNSWEAMWANWQNGGTAAAPGSRPGQNGTPYDNWGQPRDGEAAYSGTRNQKGASAGVGQGGAGFAGNQQQWDPNRPWLANSTASTAAPGDMGRKPEWDPSSPWNMRQPGNQPGQNGTPRDNWGQPREGTTESPWTGTKNGGYGDTTGTGTRNKQNPPGGAVNPYQPINIAPWEYNKMSPTFKANLEGEWSAQSLDPNDMWAKMRAAWPKGNAQTRTIWR